MIYFGLDLDSPLTTEASSLDLHYAGPRKLLRLLEQALGWSGFPERNDYLRIEMYRQSLQQYLSKQPDAFYNASFTADRFATATVLLQHRDTLLLSGWDFKNHGNTGRLPIFAGIEAIFQQKKNDPAYQTLLTGEADRWQQVLTDIPTAVLPFGEIMLMEPLSVLPVHIRRVMTALAEKGISIACHTDQPQALHSGGMLHRFQQYISGQQIERGCSEDEPCEIVFIHARSDADAAVFLAQTLAQNPDWKPHFMIPDLRQNLELALMSEGLPPFGILSATLARPALQVLKLAPAFIWEPVDIFKIMEFVTLPVKPLDRGLALEIARVLAEKPGMYSDQWFGAVLGYLNQPNITDEIKEQYNFWFQQRRRYRIETAAPKREIIDMYVHLQEWATRLFDQSKDATLLTVSQQARRITDLLETLPEQRISFLELERIVRTIVEPSPAFFAETAQHHYPYFHQAGAAIAPMNELIWWNCLYEDDTPPPDFWQPAERAWLDTLNSAPETLQVFAQRKLLLRMRPILQTRKRLWLFLPEQTGGMPAVHHLIASDIGTLLGNTRNISFHIGIPEQRAALAARIQRDNPLNIPANFALAARKLPGHQPWLSIPWKETDHNRDETPTGLESLFYFPHSWFLKQKVGIFPSNLLSVTRDNTLLGNLSHRFFELLLVDTQFVSMSRTEIGQWIEDTAQELLRKEGATLLLYGREPERKVFLTKIKNAAWNLVSMLRANDWTVLATEKELTGAFAGVSVRGKADLVLQRGTETAIVDLKWSGFNYRKDLILNEEDLQLVLYGHLLPPEGTWPHTAYFILESGKMLARNQAAFKEATIAGKGAGDHTEVCQRIFDRMVKTFEWRLNQLKNGRLEIRTNETVRALEEFHAAELSELLEMKTSDAKWDAYRALIDFM